MGRGVYEELLDFDSKLWRKRGDSVVEVSFLGGYTASGSLIGSEPGPTRPVGPLARMVGA